MQEVLFKDVLFFKADKNYTEVFLVNEKKLVVCMPLCRVEELLPADVFIKVHRSHLVMIHQIRKFDHHNVWTDDKHKIPVGRMFYKSLLERLIVLWPDHTKTVEQGIKELTQSLLKRNIKYV